MKTKLSLSLLLLFVMSPVFAQNNSEVYDYYNSKINEAVLAVGNTAADVADADANPAYAQLFMSPVLYESVVEDAFAGTEEDADTDSKLLAMGDERKAVVDAMLMGVYRDAPQLVEMTEAEVRKERVVAPHVMAATAPELKFAKLEIPEEIVGGMKTTVAKPNYWKFSGGTSLTFTQSFLSDNWYQGGEKNYYAMLATIDLDLNYDDKDRISWTNHFDFDLGFATYLSDDKLGIKTNTDKLRLESTFGYKLVKSLDLAAKMKVESQSLPNYVIGSEPAQLLSAFLSPLDANASVGFNYKPDLGKFKIEIYLAPFSGYNLRYVRHDDLTYMYGLCTLPAEGEEPVIVHAKHDFGTQLVVTVPTYQLTSFLDVYSRLEYYTNYKRAFFQWETKFNVILSKYFTASLMLNARFDDSVNRNENWKYWQLKELFTLGVTYRW